MAPMGWGGGGCDGGSQTGRKDELLPWSSRMAYASKMSTITALPAAVLEPLTAVLAKQPGCWLDVDVGGSGGLGEPCTIDETAVLAAVHA